MGIPTEEEDVPEHYFCERCQPEDHKELLEGIKRGEKPWLDREKAAKNARRKSGKKGKKGGRQSRVSNVKIDAPEEAVSESPAPAPEPAPSSETGTKRKFEEEPPQVSHSKPGASTQANP